MQELGNRKAAPFWGGFFVVAGLLPRLRLGDELFSVELREVAVSPDSTLGRFIGLPVGVAEQVL